MLAYLLRGRSARGAERLRAIEREAAAVGLTGGEQQAYVWSRSRFRSEIKKQLARLEVALLARKDLMEWRTRRRWDEALENASRWGTPALRIDEVLTSASDDREIQQDRQGWKNY